MIALMAFVFLAGLAIFVSVLYFLVEAPASNRALRERLEAIRETFTTRSPDRETELLRRDVLSHIPALDRFLETFRPFLALNLFLRQAAVKMTVGMLLILTLSLSLIGFVVGMLLKLFLPLVILLAIAAGAVPSVVISIKRRLRLSKFDEQFPDAIDLLARAVRAGHAFTTGLELIGTEMPNPVSEEFRKVYEQQNLGLSLREALQNMLGRVPLPDMHVFVTALLIQRESGGNLAEILDSLSHVIRERFKLSRQVKVYTAQGRMSLYMLSALAPATALVMYLLNPDYMARLFTDPLGQRALAVAVIMQVIGYLIIRKITQPKI